MHRGFLKICEAITIVIAIFANTESKTGCYGGSERSVFIIPRQNPQKLLDLKRPKRSLLWLRKSQTPRIKDKSNKDFGDSVQPNASQSDTT